MPEHYHPVDQNAVRSWVSQINAGDATIETPSEGMISALGRAKAEGRTRHGDHLSSLARKGGLETPFVQHFNFGGYTSQQEQPRRRSEDDWVPMSSNRPPLDHITELFDYLDGLPR